jgi:hypothetical protein
VPTTAVTPKNLIKLALRQAGVVGIGQSVRAEDEQDMFANLNMMLALWQRDRYLVWQTVDIFAEANGSESYSIGPGMTFNVARPSRIEQGFARLNPSGSPMSVDYPLTPLFSREDYDRIRIKQLGSFPRFVYYDRGYPTGNVFVWPLPGDAFEVHLTLMQQLQSFSNPSEQINMPPEYQDAILQNLTIRACAMWSLPPNPVTVKLATKALNLLRGSNAEIPSLTLPGVGNQPNIYDPYGAGSL